MSPTSPTLPKLFSTDIDLADRVALIQKIVIWLANELVAEANSAIDDYNQKQNQTVRRKPRLSYYTLAHVKDPPGRRKIFHVRDATIYLLRELLGLSFAKILNILNIKKSLSKTGCASVYRVMRRRRRQKPFINAVVVRAFHAYYTALAKHYDTQRQGQARVSFEHPLDNQYRTFVTVTAPHQPYKN